jgi:hypothetical protein
MALGEIKEPKGSADLATDSLEVPAHICRVSGRAARGDLHGADKCTTRAPSARCRRGVNLSPTLPRCAADAAWVRQAASGGPSGEQVLHAPIPAYGSPASVGRVSAECRFLL